MATDRRIFVLVDNGKCGTCIRFKTSYWGTKEKPLELRQIVDKNFKVVEIHVPTFNDKIPASYPHYLRTRVGYYPFLALFTEASWQKALKEPDTPHMLEGTVYGANMDEKGVWRSTNVEPHDPDSVQVWAGLKARTPSSPSAPAPAGHACARRAQLRQMPPC